MNRSISLDANALRKMIRERTCRPEVRDILECLLLYLTEELPILARRNVDMNLTAGDAAHREGSTMVAESIIVMPVDSAMPNPGECDTTWAGSPRRQNSVDPADKRAGGQRAGEPKQKRLTAFQLLQAKFTRTTPRPAASHQRQVGALHCAARGRGAYETLERQSAVCGPETHQPKRRQWQKAGSNVKGMVARFATAEEKVKGVNTQGKTQSKARLIGKGPLLSSLMERFEAISTVRKKSGSISPLGKAPGGVGMTTGCVSEKVSLHEKAQQTTREERKGGGLKHRPTVGEKFRSFLLNTCEQEEKTECPRAMLSQQNSAQKEQKHSKPTQPSNLSPDQKVKWHFSKESQTRKLWNSKPDDTMDDQNGVEELCGSEAGEMEHGSLTPNCPRSSAVEWSLPETLRLAAKEEASLGCYRDTLACSKPSLQQNPGRTDSAAAEDTRRPHPEAFTSMTTECSSGVPLRSSHTGEPPQVLSEDQSGKASSHQFVSQWFGPITVLLTTGGVVKM